MKRKFELGIKAGIAFPLLTTLVIGMAILGVYNYMSQVALLDDEARANMETSVNVIHTTLDGHLKLYHEMATLVANIPTVQEVFAKRDRNRLINEFLPAYNLLKERFKLAQFHFHTPPAVSFLRMHTLDRWGDDISSHRITVVAVNDKKSGVIGLEAGVGGLGLRGVEPISFKGQHVGSVDFGGDLSPVLDEAKKGFNAEAGLLISKDTLKYWPGLAKLTKSVGDYVSFYSTKSELSDGLLTADLVVKAKREGKKVYIDEAAFGGKDYYVAISPVKDFAGKEIGYVYVIRDRTAALTKILKTLTINAAIYILIVVFIAAAIGYGMTKNVIKPVIDLTKAADDISMGKLSDKVEIKDAKGELAILSKSIDRMRVSMKKLLE